VWGMRGSRWVWMALWAICALMIAPAAWSAPEGKNALAVHVVAVKSDEALDQAEALTTALKKAVIHSDGWSLGKSEEALEFRMLQLGCTSVDADCQTKIADFLKADRFLWAEIEFDGKDKAKVSGTLNFFVRGKGTNKIEIAYPASYTDPNSDWLLEEAEKMVAKVTGGAPMGTLVVNTNGVAGEVFLDGESMGDIAATGRTFDVKAGAHKVLVKADGYEDAEGSGTVLPNGSVTVTLTMVAITKAPPPDFRLIGGIAALTVGVAAGAVGLWSSLEVNGIDNDDLWVRYTDAVPEGMDACDQATDGAPGSTFPSQFLGDRDKLVEMCDDAATFEVIQAVMYPVAAVSAGVGIFLIGTSRFASGEDGDSESAIQVHPMIGPDLQAIAVSYSF
jgi:hypothetical protein